jgi:hypothetical protein
MLCAVPSSEASESTGDTIRASVKLPTLLNHELQIQSFREFSYHDIFLYRVEIVS